MFRKRFTILFLNLCTKITDSYDSKPHLRTNLRKLSHFPLILRRCERISRYPQLILLKEKTKKSGRQREYNYVLTTLTHLSLFPPLSTLLISLIHFIVFFCFVSPCFFFSFHRVPPYLTLRVLEFLFFPPPPFCDNRDHRQCSPGGSTVE